MGAIPPPPAGFKPVEDIPPPPAGFKPVQAPSQDPRQQDVELLRSQGWTPERIQMAMSSPGYEPGQLTKVRDRPDGFGSGIVAGFNRGAHALAGAADRLGALLSFGQGAQENRYNAALEEAQAAAEKARINQRSGRQQGDEGSWYNNPAEKVAEMIPAAAAATALPFGALGGALGKMAPAGTRVSAKIARWGIGKAIPASLEGGTVAALGTPGTAEERLKAGAVTAATMPAWMAGMEGILASSGLAKAGAKKLLGGATTPQAQAAAQEVRALGERYGVRTTVGDITGNPGTRKAEVLLESVPGVGMGSFRKAQDQEAHQAAEGILGKLGQVMKGTSYESLPAIERAAANGDKQAGLLLQEIDAAGDDWNRILQTSGKSKLFGEKLKANDLYGEAEKLSPKKPVQASQAIRVLKQAQDHLEQLPEAAQDSKLLGFVRRLRTDLESTVPQPQGQPKLSRVFDAATGEFRDVATPAAQEGPVFDATYTGMSRLRSYLRGLRDDANRGTGELTGTDAGRLIGQVKSALEGDMETFANKEGGAFSSARKDADLFYRTHVVPFKDNALVKAFQSQEPDQVYSRFIQFGKEDRAANFYKALDPKGQAAIRFGMVQEAMDKALNQGAAGEEATFSPARFAGYMRKFQDASGVLFKGQDKWEIDGFTRLMDHIRRAGQFAENPPTGNRLATSLPAIGAATQLAAAVPLSFSNPAAAAATVGTVGLEWLSAKGLQQLFTTPTGKKFLLEAATAKPGTPAMDLLLKRYTPMLLASSTGKAASFPDAPQAPQP